MKPSRLAFSIVVRLLLPRGACHQVAKGSHSATSNNDEAEIGAKLTLTLAVGRFRIALSADSLAHRRLAVISSPIISPVRIRALTVSKFTPGHAVAA